MRGVTSTRSAVAYLVVLGMTSVASAQTAGGAQRGGREGGAQEGPRVVTAALVIDMQLKMPPSQTGQTKVVQDYLTSGTPGSATTPYSLWSGECEQPFATMFRSRTDSLDLAGTSKIRWTVKTSGFHAVRPIVKLLDGTMYAGEYSSESVPMLLTSSSHPLDQARSEAPRHDQDARRAIQLHLGEPRPEPGRRGGLCRFDAWERPWDQRLHPRERVQSVWQSGFALRCDGQPMSPAP
jgi:hypothetical protein